MKKSITKTLLTVAAMGYPTIVSAQDHQDARIIDGSIKHVGYCLFKKANETDGMLTYFQRGQNYEFVLEGKTYRTLRGTFNGPSFQGSAPSSSRPSCNYIATVTRSSDGDREDSFYADIDIKDHCGRFVFGIASYDGVECYSLAPAVVD